jgi:hypothetical protein
MQGISYNLGRKFCQGFAKKQRYGRLMNGSLQAIEIMTTYQKETPIFFAKKRWGFKTVGLIDLRFGSYQRPCLSSGNGLSSF